MHRHRAQGKNKSVAIIPRAMFMSSNGDGFLQDWQSRGLNFAQDFEFYVVLSVP